LGCQAHGAARITGEVPALAAALAGLEPEAAVGPQCADAVDVRASVRVDRGQPAGMTVRPAAARRLLHARAELVLDAGPVEQRELVQVGKVGSFHTCWTIRDHRTHRGDALIACGPRSPGRIPGL